MNDEVIGQSQVWFEAVRPADPAEYEMWNALLNGIGAELDIEGQTVDVGPGGTIDLNEDGTMTVRTPIRLRPIEHPN